MEAAVYEVFIVCEWVVMSFSLVLQFFVTACGPEINPKGNIFSGKGKLCGSIAISGLPNLEEECQRGPQYTHLKEAL